MLYENIIFCKLAVEDPFFRKTEAKAPKKVIINIAMYRYISIVNLLLQLNRLH